MCGLTGFFHTPPRDAAQMEATLRRMTGTIAHRGPDDSGHWVDGSTGIALGFRRLAIVDLSELGHQPMQSAGGRFQLVYNGEVFNHNALREELRSLGWSFRGHSDTEVVLAAFEQWGIPDAVTRFIGMFAMAVWDVQQRALTLIRDRLGIKPVFVYAEPGLVSFGSELKALVAGPAFDRSIDPDALTAYLRYLYVPAPQTIYRRATKLLPGHLLTITDPSRPLPAPVPFWSAEGAALHGEDHRFQGSDAEATAELERLLTDSVRLRMQADVPVGALLSGGIDSSAVVALMQSVSDRKVRTYTIGFGEREYDEAAHAAAVARHIGTEHTALQVSGDDALALVPRLPDMFDEPLADPSQLPTFLVCQLARREVTVALTGDGGDEVFAGYNRYLHGSQLLPRLSGVPRAARRAVRAGLGALGPDSWDSLHRAVARVVPAARSQRLVGMRVQKVRQLLAAGSEAEMYRSLLSAWQDPGRLVLGGTDAPGPFVERLAAARPRSLVERMILADQESYLPDDLLAKVDRASMAVSLEARVPLLDHRVIEFGWRLPMHMKLREGQGKWILRQVLYRHVPREMVERPKMGFSVPISAWLRGPLRGWANDLLSEGRLGRVGLLDGSALRAEWAGFQRDQGSDGTRLWAALHFLDWHARWSQ
jgi:asparagine synthase (glutamine-hydrolysing)